MDIGRRIRDLRKSKKLTLAELSEKSGVAVATLSRIENGRMTGTLESHISIAKALDLTLPELYSDMEKPLTIQKKDDYADLFVHDEKASSIILTKDIFSKKMLPVMIRLKKGGQTHKEEASKGTEKFIYILEGKIEINIGETKNTLDKGATLYFDASKPHFIRNAGNREASCISVVTPSTL